MILTFSVDTFNGLVGHYDHVRHYGDKDLGDMLPIINKFGDLFIKHGVEKHAGLSLSHRHFKLKEGEKKLARQPDRSTLIIKAVPEDEATRALPYLLLPVAGSAGNGPQLVPLEYVLHEDAAQMKSLEGDIERVCNEEFLQEFLELAAANKVDGVYGLTLASRDTLEVNKQTHGTLEGSGCQPRSLVVKVIRKDDDSDENNKDITTVAWKFKEDAVTGKVVPISACSSLIHGEAGACWHQCNHCGHCSNYYH